MRLFPESTTKISSRGPTTIAHGYANSPTPAAPAAPIHAERATARVETLQPIVSVLDHHQRAVRQQLDVVRKQQLARAAANRAERAQQLALRVEVTDAMIAGVRHPQRTVRRQ